MSRHEKSSSRLEPVHVLCVAMSMLNSNLFIFVVTTYKLLYAIFMNNCYGNIVYYYNNIFCEFNSELNFHLRLTAESTNEALLKHVCVYITA